MSVPRNEHEAIDVEESQLDVAASMGGDFGDSIVPARTILLADMLDDFFTKLEAGEPPVRWPVGEGWGTLAFRPHTIMVIGGPPNVGKTPLLLNLLWQAMQITPSLRVLVANNESMVPELVETLTARLAEINLSDVQARNCDLCTSGKLAEARSALRGVADRIEFMEMPFTLEQVIERAMDFRADVVCIDTLQKLSLEGYDGEMGDRLGRIMPMLRDLASRGPCVVAAAQISREGVRHFQGRVGRATYDERDMAVFAYSVQIESSANDCFYLAYETGARVHQGLDQAYEPIPMWLHHMKGRNTLKANIPLLFDGRYQKFMLRPVHEPAAGQRGAGGRRSTGDIGRTDGTSGTSKAAWAKPRTSREELQDIEGEADGDHEWLT